ncbi:MAG: DUF2252 family protein [Acidobacteria bacterium]|nr:DUF2252 family protein [Acidobacteriota bacterium]
MTEGCFPFLRATFYRWAQLFPEICKAQHTAPRVLGVGDLHVENFGTWRDIEGRLVWGVNDFDEAATAPYLIDIVRLLASVEIARGEQRVHIATADALEAFRGGYREHLESGGEPIVLMEKHPALRTMAVARLKNPAAFWTKLNGLETLRGGVPTEAARGVRALLPDRKATGLRWVHRTAGLGSLGRRRFVAIASWRGGLIAREAKELAPSAAVWAGWAKQTSIRYQELIETSVRSTDPFVRLRRKWLIRRLAPDCSRIELASLGEQRDEQRLLQNMGRETANVHLATGKAKRLLADLESRKASELLKAVKAMVKATGADWAEWKAAHR